MTEYTLDASPKIALDNRAYHLQTAAHSAVRNALLTGDLIRQPCKQCGLPAHAHHDSYYPDRHLDVRWLCPKHHSAWHIENEPEWPTVYEYAPPPPERAREGVSISRTGRPSCPWYWRARKAWYSTMAGKRYRLAREESEAMAMFDRMVAELRAAENRREVIAIADKTA